MHVRLAPILISLAAGAALAAEPALQDYARPAELAPLPPGQASLYRVPWRANPRTVTAADALAGIGVYYKHIPGDWSEADHIAVMKQMAAAGVRRLRLAPHFAIYITKDWTAPKPAELEGLRKELRACHAAGIRPCVIFVHIPPIGQPGTRELQDWWKQGELLPAGEVGSPEFKAFLDKTYEALLFVLREARAAGFKGRESYDLELAQGLWWGAPSCPRPLPSTTLADLLPGGRIYEFDRALIQRLRQDGFREPAVWWGMTYHHFEHCTDAEVPPEAAGRTLSFYSSWTGCTTNGWLGGTMYDGRKSPNDVWPVRPPLTFAEGEAPSLVLARPEGWMADRTRRDNLIELLRAAKTPVAVTSLGTVPADIPGAEQSPFDGWQLKQRGLTRSLAFWLNQGAPFVLLHSAFEPGARAGGELAHSLIPGPIEPALFRWQHAPPLVTLRSFCEALEGAEPVQLPLPLGLRFALNPDPELIPATGSAGPLRASDAVALLPFQLDARRFAVAAYVVTPNLALPLEPLTLTLQVDRALGPDTPVTLRPATGATGRAKVTTRAEGATTLTFPIADDVTWLRFSLP
jgi:hypothetical protein